MLSSGREGGGPPNSFQPVQMTAVEWAALTHVEGGSIFNDDLDHTDISSQQQIWEQRVKDRLKLWVDRHKGRFPYDFPY